MGRARVPFHPLTNKGLYAFWYDSKRNMVFVVYVVAGAFKDAAGQWHDNYPLLSKKFRDMIRRVKPISRSADCSRPEADSYQCRLLGSHVNQAHAYSGYSGKFILCRSTL